MQQLSFASIFLVAISVRKQLLYCKQNSSFNAIYKLREKRIILKKLLGELKKQALKHNARQLPQQSSS